MPCHAAIIEKALVLKSDQPLEKALKDMKKANVDHAAVKDQDGIICGFFSYSILMKNLLPVSVVMNEGVQLDVTIRAAPGIAKRLKKVMPLTIDNFMERKNFPIVYPQTPLWEGINLIVQTNMPLTVAEPETHKYIGIISHGSALEELQRLQDSEAS